MGHDSVLEGILGYGSYMENRGYLEERLGFDYKERLDAFPSVHKLFSSHKWVDKTYDLFTISYGVLNFLSNKNLRIPKRSSAIDFIAKLFFYFYEYDFPKASEYRLTKYSESQIFNQNSYIVTHIGFLISGQGRYPITIGDSQWLYDYLRENFYHAIAEDDVDLVAEFMDNLRQYGCTEENDQQMRDGVIWMVERYNTV